MDSGTVSLSVKFPVHTESQFSCFNTEVLKDGYLWKLTGSVQKDLVKPFLSCRPETSFWGWQVFARIRLQAIHPQDVKRSWSETWHLNRFDQDNLLGYSNHCSLSWLQREGFLTDGCIQLCAQVAVLRHTTIPCKLDFSAPWLHSDVVFKTQGGCFHCHKSILSLASPVFKAMFNGAFKESHESAIQLPDKNSRDLQDFFELVYLQMPGTFLTRDKTPHVARLAHEYQVERVLTACEDSLRAHLCKQTALEAVLLAEELCMGLLREEALEVLQKWDKQTLCCSETYSRLSDRSRANILERRVSYLERNRN